MTHQYLCPLLDLGPYFGSGGKGEFRKETPKPVSLNAKPRPPEPPKHQNMDFQRSRIKSAVEASGLLHAQGAAESLTYFEFSLKPQTPNRKPSTRNPQLSTLNPKP